MHTHSVNRYRTGKHTIIHKITIIPEHFIANENVSKIRARRGQMSATKRSAQREASSHCEQDSPKYVRNIVALHAVRLRTNLSTFSGKICPAKISFHIFNFVQIFKNYGMNQDL